MFFAPSAIRYESGNTVLVLGINNRNYSQQESYEVESRFVDLERAAFFHILFVR